MAEQSIDALKAYARHVILDHATDIEYTSIYEMADDFFDGVALDGDDLDRVDRLITNAKITVTWGD